MTTAKKLIAAAGAAGAGEATYVEDVFSTYLYEGTGSTQTINNGIALGGFGVGTSTKFNNLDSDYLSRSSDLSGNTDSNSFTFSVWLKFDNLDGYRIYQVSDGSNGRFVIQQVNSSLIVIKGFNSSGTRLIDGDLSYSLSTNVWYHILISIDLSSASNRKVYINDVDLSGAVSWGTYTNANIDFTNSIHEVSTDRHGGSYYDGNMAHLFLDYTYRNLSTTSNRRLFIDADGGSTPPSTLSALSPIIYLPMTDGYSIGENLGTGGDFTPNNSPTIVSEGTEYDADVAEGGLVWIKNRYVGSGWANHYLFDTERSPTNSDNMYYLRSNSTAGQSGTNTNTAHDFGGWSSNGFMLGSPFSMGSDALNGSGSDYASWTFRKAPKFFDVVTYTGTGSVQNINHNLGVEPGCMFIKRTDSSQNWWVYHRGVDASPESYYLTLNTNEARVASGILWNNTEPTDSVFTIDSSASVSGGTYVAYLFAHNDGDGEFGEDGDQDIIKCGSYTGNGSSSGPSVDVGFEAQWIMIKAASRTGEWIIHDNMRGMAVGGNDAFLMPNNTGVEQSYPRVDVTATGFNLTTDGTIWNDSNQTYIYIAIRRGPMKTPESGTEVFESYDCDNNADHFPEFISGFPVDMAIFKNTTGGDPTVASRLQGATRSMYAHTNGSEINFGSALTFDYMNGFYETNLNNTHAWMFRRAPGFFDVVAYEGNGTVGHVINHNLGVAPEWIIVKKRDSGGSFNDWYTVTSVYFNTNPYDKNGIINSGNGFRGGGWVSSADEDSFTISNSFIANESGFNHIAYLFSSVSGVSKVGTYTGNGSSQTVNCGFSSGARFVIIKEIGATSDWHVFDTERGIVAGNDPRIELNTTDAEDTGTDYIDPVSSGFAVTSNSNVNTNSTQYFFYAVA